STSAADVGVIHPSGVSAQDMFLQGIQLLREGNRDDAFAVFQQAYHSGQKLNPHDQQQLEDFLRELAPNRGRDIRQVGQSREEFAGGPSIGAGPRAATPESGHLEIVEQQMAVKYDKLRTE